MSPPDAAGPPAEAEGPLQGTAKRLASAKSDTAAPTVGGIIPRTRGPARLPGWQLFGAELRKVGPGEWAMSKSDIAAHHFAIFQLEHFDGDRTLAEATLRKGGFRRNDLPRYLGIGQGQVDHLLSGRRSPSVVVAVMLGRALMRLSAKESEQRLSRSGGTRRSTERRGLDPEERRILDEFIASQEGNR